MRMGDVRGERRIFVVCIVFGDGGEGKDSVMEKRGALWWFGLYAVLYVLGNIYN